MFKDFFGLVPILAVILILSVKILKSENPFSDGAIELNMDNELCDTLVIKNDLSNLIKLNNCQIIDGSLTITNIKDPTIQNFTFPSLIEVTGCFKILTTDYLLSIGSLFPNLAIIRGKSSNETIALEVIDNKDLTEIGLKSLRYIGNGNVRIQNNKILCFAETIDWSVIALDSKENEIQNSHDDCGKCQSAHCWSLDIPQVICDVTCGTRFCTSRNTSKCCDDSCVGGCGESDIKMCTACKHVSFNNSCVDSCPLNFFKFRDRECITADQCLSMNQKLKKEFLVPFNGVCSDECPIGFVLLRLDDSNIHYKCSKVCYNVSITETNIRAEKLSELKGCEIVEGYLKIENISHRLCYEDNEISFKLDQFLSSIIEINGFLAIKNSSMFKDLAFFQKLRKISTNLSSGNQSLILIHNEYLKYIWFPNRNISINGESFIDSNPELCNDCQEMIEVESIPFLYAVKILWKLLGNINSSKVQSYVLILWNGSSVGFCDKLSHIKSFKTSENFFIFHYLKPNQIYYYQLYLLNSTGKRVAASSRLRFETLATLIDGFKSVKTTSDAITLSWNKPENDNRTLIRYDVKAYYYFPLNLTYFEQLDFCKVVIERNDIDEYQQFILSDEELENYDWKDDEIITLLFKDFVNENNLTDDVGYKYVYRTVNSSETTLTIDRLRNFSHYYILIRACYDNSNEITCSNPTRTLARTESDLDADIIENFLVDSRQPNTIDVVGKIPEKPNGFVFYFTIRYLTSSDARTVCASHKEIKENGRKVIKNVPDGNYTVNVVSRSLAGFTLSNTHFVKVKSLETTDQSNSHLYLIVCSSAIVIILIVYTLYFVTSKNNVGVFKVTENPFYMTFIYKPDDEYEIDRKNVLVLEEEIGAGYFGTVHEGKLLNYGENNSELTCAVKTVNKDALYKDCASFLKEASIMKNFKTEHVIRLLGIVSKSHPYLVVMELMVNGDLKSFLQKNRPQSCIAINDGYTSMPMTQFIPPISHMAIQIADGMSYLSAKKFVHRDLASRNCMLDGDCTVKIGDFGLARDIYESDYYRRRQKNAMPVRWMAPESLADGIFSSKSDVFSYGVVLWEIVTFAKQPYHGLENEHVLNHIIGGGTLEKPHENCPDNIFNIMTKCWQFNPEDRITFKKIVEELLDEAPEKFLQHSFYNKK